MSVKEISELEGVINRLQAEGEKYHITNRRLLAMCEAIESVILKATPDDFEYSRDGFEIKRFKGYDSGIFRDFRYVRYLDRPLTEVWFNDARVGTICGTREQRMHFLKNLNKILTDLATDLEKNNLEAEELLSHVKVV